MTDNKKKEQGDKLDVRQDVTDRIIKAMESGLHSWAKSWASSGAAPRNATTDAAYSGINRVLLAIEGRSDPRWVTYKQAEANGWQVRKGERGCGIVRPVEVEIKEKNEKGEEATKKIPSLKRYIVFNASQVDGIPEIQIAERNSEFKPNERAEAMADALVVRTGLTIEFGKGEPSYIPSADKVVMPAREAFSDEPHFYTTLMHECGHSTLAANRLNRSEAMGRFGDERYAREELRAEIASAFLAAETGIPLSDKHIESHAGYLQSWIKALRGDKQEIFRACKDAQAISDYIVKNEAEQRKAMTATNVTATNEKVSEVAAQPTPSKQAIADSEREAGMAFGQ
jgi:antirestriction protein ArdC